MYDPISRRNDLATYSRKTSIRQHLHSDGSIYVIRIYDIFDISTHISLRYRYYRYRFGALDIRVFGYDRYGICNK